MRAKVHIPKASGDGDTEVVMAGVSPAVEPWRPARRNGVDDGRAQEKFAVRSGGRDASPLRQARTSDATVRVPESFEGGRLLREGCQQENRLLAILAEESEMAIDGTDLKCAVHFRQPDDASVGKIHGSIGVTIQECANGDEFVRQRRDRKSVV